ncbi:MULTISPECIES: hypothetical protein [unclassified Endozoicomonas]|nr:MULTISPECIES: hypothetical protein [unclassified Endozoicomonas]
MDTKTDIRIGFKSPLMFTLDRDKHQIGISVAKAEAFGHGLSFPD